MSTLKHYGPFSLALSLSLLLIACYWPVSLNIWQYSFDDGTYSHAYLVPFVAIYLLYDAKHLLQLRQELNLWLVAFICLSLCAVYFYLTQYGLVVLFLMPAVLISFLLAVFKYHLSLVVFSCLFWFVTPIWGALSPPLQQLSTVAVEALIHFTSVPSYIEGNTVFIPSGSFEIANGCSGLRYFITSLFFCLLFSYFYLKQATQVVIFLLTAIAGALVVNWLRIIIIIIIGHQTEMQSSLVHDHNNLGWALYIPYLAIIYWFGNKLSAKINPTTETQADPVRWNWPLMGGSIAILILLSPVAIDRLLKTKPEQSHDTSIVNQLFNEPVAVFNYSQVDNVQSNGGFFSRFIFNGYGLSNKASFFENNVIPDYLKVNRQYERQGFTIVELQDNYGSKFAAVYRYHTMLGSTSNLSALKQLRLKMAVQGQRRTELWLGAALCTDSCAVSINQLLHSPQWQAWQP